MPQESQIVIGPNASLGIAQAWGFMAASSVLGLGIAGGFAALGFWPMLPFAGLEIGALGAALWVSMRRNGYREVLRIDEREVCIGFGRLGRGPQRESRLQRHWTRVVLEPGRNRNAPTRLLLCSAGRRVEVGRCLTDEERERLRTRLDELLRPGRRQRPDDAGVLPAHELPLGE